MHNRARRNTTRPARNPIEPEGRPETIAQPHAPARATTLDPRVFRRTSNRHVVTSLSERIRSSAGGYRGCARRRPALRLRIRRNRRRRAQTSLRAGRARVERPSTEAWSSATCHRRSRFGGSGSPARSSAEFASPILRLTALSTHEPQRRVTPVKRTAAVPPRSTASDSAASSPARPAVPVASASIEVCS